MRPWPTRSTTHASWPIRCVVWVSMSSMCSMPTKEPFKMRSFELQDRLLKAGKDAVGLFYYSGHGVQVDGQNYLIPLNSKIEK